VPNNLLQNVLVTTMYLEESMRKEELIHAFDLSNFVPNNLLQNVLVTTMYLEESMRKEELIHAFFLLIVRRKSYFFSSGAHTTNANTMPASQSRNMTESQTSQDDTRASVSEKNEQSVPSRSNNRAISDGLVEEG
jgi:hypothetical protein